MTDKKDVLRATDEEARDLGRQLLRATPAGALATASPHDAWPGASLVIVATDLDGTPIILISSLSAHTAALRQDARCSLLLSRPGRGDALAHPRISLQARARFMDRDSDAGRQVRRRFLARHYKAALYADFGDFTFVRLELNHAALNGGFGKAYHLEVTDLLVPESALHGFASVESDAITHMNEDHADAVRRLAMVFAGGDDAAWRLTGIDPHGCDFAADSQVLRMAFGPPLGGPKDIHARLKRLAHDAVIRAEAPGRSRE